MPRLHRLESATCTWAILLIALGGPFVALFVLMPALVIIGLGDPVWFVTAVLTLVGLQLLLTGYIGYRAADIGTTLTASVMVALVPTLVSATALGWQLILAPFIASAAICLTIHGLLRALLGQTIDPATIPSTICPACGYNLIGLTSDRCPECGGPNEAVVNDRIATDFAAARDLCADHSPVDR